MSDEEYTLIERFIDIVESLSNENPENLKEKHIIRLEEALKEIDDDKE